MKVALVGIGKIALDQHIPSIAASPDWELAATVSRHRSVAGIENFADVEALLHARPDIGTISLCSPPAPRFEQACAALAAGRNLMLEKPPGATLSECRELERLARKAGVTLYATWHSRAAAQVGSAKAWLAGRKLRRLAAVWKEDARRWHPGQAWIWEPGGFGVFDPGINALSIMTEILAHPFHVTRSTLEYPENRQAPIAASIAFRHPEAEDVSARFDWREGENQTWTIEAETESGHMVLSDGGAVLVIDGETQPTPYAADDALRGEYPRLYARMADLVRARAVDMDLAPLTLVADAFLLGRRITVAPYDE